MTRHAVTELLPEAGKSFQHTECDLMTAMLINSQSITKCYTDCAGS